MAEREMTLQEWVERLPEIHAARREYDALAARLAEYEEKDGQRTREHNILVRENREQAARLVEVERDAARYEWLRANPAWESEAYLFGLSPDQFDSAVDAAITSSILQHPKSNADSSG